MLEWGKSFLRGFQKPDVVVEEEVNQSAWIVPLVQLNIFTKTVNGLGLEIKETIAAGDMIVTEHGDEKEVWKDRLGAYIDLTPSKNQQLTEALRKALSKG